MTVQPLQHGFHRQIVLHHLLAIPFAIGGHDVTVRPDLLSQFREHSLLFGIDEFNPSFDPLAPFYRVPAGLDPSGINVDRPSIEAPSQLNGIYVFYHWRTLVLCHTTILCAVVLGSLLTRIMGASTYTTLGRDTNQARGLAEYALRFLADTAGDPDEMVYEKVGQFHLDSVACAVSAIGCGCNAPTILRREALEYRVGGPASRRAVFRLERACDAGKSGGGQLLGGAGMGRQWHEFRL